MKFSLASLLPSLALVGLFPIQPAEGGTIIDDHFDDGTVTGWESIGNSLAATHHLTEGDSKLTSEVIGTDVNLNTNRGIVSTTSFDPAAEAGGFTMTFEVSSQAVLEPGANGMFLGLTSSNETFFRLDGVSTFGLVFFGLPARTDSAGGVSLVTDDIGDGGPAVEGLILDANPDSIELSSFQDGFSATVMANPEGWEFSVGGINDLGGTPITISKSGSWDEAGTDYASVFAAGDEWFVLASNQGLPPEANHTVVYDQISLRTGTGSGEDTFRITSIVPDLGGDEPAVTIVWNSVAGTDYAIEYSTDLGEESWAEITDSATGEGEQTEFVHEFLPSFPDLVGVERIFYRVRIP